MYVHNLFRLINVDLERKIAAIAMLEGSVESFTLQEQQVYMHVYIACSTVCTNVHVYAAYCLIINTAIRLHGICMHPPTFW